MAGIFADWATNISNIDSLESASSQSVAANAGDVQLPLIKIIKDVFLILSIFGAFFSSYKDRFSHFRNLAFLRSLPFLFAFIGFAFVNSIFTSGFLLGLVGLRVFSPMLAIFVGSFLRLADFKFIGHIIVTSVLIEVFVALLQMDVGLNVLGAGIGYRVTGSFFNPNTLAYFATTSFLFIVFIENLLLKQALIGSVIFLVIATGSRSGMIALALLLWGLLTLKQRNVTTRLVSLLLTLFLLPIILSLIEAVADRGSIFEHLDINDSTRLGIFIDLFESGSIFDVVFGRGLGVGSNLLYSLSNFIDIDFRYVFTADSTLSSLFAQGGVVMLIVFIWFLVECWMFVLSRRYDRVTMYFLVLVIPLLIMIYSVSASFFEVAPTNILLFLLIGFLIRPQSAPELSQRD